MTTVTLSEFIGEIVHDIAKARNLADAGSAALSEQYYADPFIKNLPIPHYTIDEAEIEVPVMVTGVNLESEEYRKLSEDVLSVVREKLPALVLRAYQWNYRKRKKAEAEKRLRDRAGERNAQIEASREEKKRTEPVLKEEKIEIPDETVKLYLDASKRIAKEMAQHVASYLKSYNYEILKLLDLTEDFSAELARQFLLDRENYSEADRPYPADEAAVNRSASYVGNLMFFEFKQLFKTNAGVTVSVATGPMNEYAEHDCLMRIKLKVREQDLDFVVEDKDGREKRFLTLN